jgi:hypothetical protein
LLPEEFPFAGFASTAITANVVVDVGAAVIDPVEATGPSDHPTGAGLALSEARPFTSQVRVTLCPAQIAGGATVNVSTWALPHPANARADCTLSPTRATTCADARFGDLCES